MARLQNAGHVAATILNVDRSGPFADDRESLLPQGFERQYLR